MEQHRTINGKPISQVFEELTAPVEDSAFKLQDETGYYYLDVNFYYDRLVQTLGNDHFDFIPSKPDITPINGQYIISQTGYISIKDDDGNVVKKVGSCGGYTITINKNTGNCPNFNSDAKSCTSNVFRNCASLLGIGKKQLADRRKNNVHSKSSAKTQNPNSKKYTVIVKQKLTAIKNGYRTTCSFNNSTYDLIFWEDALQSITKCTTIDTFVNSCIPGITLTFLGYEKEFRGKKQIIMTSTCQQEKTNE